ncbi:hypothetical protein MBOE_20870 [Mycolicibacterium boenickei]|uniref:Uncharacterized protein n=1 Tax=Mycolicibacterium boenickei TaxID=146017 RepID=A0ABN5Z886_9MYCO|nr:hypothetical protein MBOE_20870 [Mycolicibacterium boenickei]
MGDTGNPLCGRLCRVGVAAVDHHTRTLGGKEFGNRQPDTAGAADHDRAAAGQRPGGQFPSSCANCMASRFQ